MGLFLVLVCAFIDGEARAPERTDHLGYRPKAKHVGRKRAHACLVSIGSEREHETTAGYVTKRTLRGYAARNSLSVRVRQIEKAGVLAGQLMDKGANRFEGIAFDYPQKEGKYDALRGDAVRDALRKANSYVSGLGLKLGRVLEIVTQAPSRVLPTTMSAGIRAKSEAAAAVPVEPGSEVLRTEVQVTWELAQ